MRDLQDVLSEDDRRALMRPVETAVGLPGAVYTSADFYALERERLFPTVWVAAAMGAELPKPGDALPRMVAGWPLVFVRTQGGEIRCFHNICRHRGMAVVPEACGGQRMLRCPWHGWVYDLDGALAATPEFAGIDTHDANTFSKERRGLIPVRCARWFDFVFVNIDGAAPPLDVYLAPLTNRFRDYRNFSDFYYSRSWHHSYEGNWKIAVEGAIEDYHLPWVHPQITEGRKRADRSAVEVGGDSLFLVSSEKAGLADGRTAGDLPRLPRIEGIAGPDAASTFFLNIFPTGIMGIARDGLYAAIWLPDGPARTVLDFHFYFVGEEAARGGRYAASRANWINLVTGVFEQDTMVVKALQERAAIRDSIGIRTCFSPFWETAVHRFQQRVFELVASPAT